MNLPEKREDTSSVGHEEKSLLGGEGIPRFLLLLPLPQIEADLNREEEAKEEEVTRREARNLGGKEDCVGRASSSTRGGDDGMEETDLNPNLS